MLGVTASEAARTICDVGAVFVSCASSLLGLRAPRRGLPTSEHCKQRLRERDAGVEDAPRGSLACGRGRVRRPLEAVEIAPLCGARLAEDAGRVGKHELAHMPAARVIAGRGHTPHFHSACCEGALSGVRGWRANPRTRNNA
jgi:hypothetical protein